MLSWLGLSLCFPIVSARLRLRPLHRDDVDALAAVYLHPLVDRWIGPNTRADVEHEIALQIEHQATLGWSFWAVEERASGRFVGDCGLQPLEHRGPEVELGYDLHPDFWGRGLASEAATAGAPAGCRGALTVSGGQANSELNQSIINRSRC